MSGMQRRKTLVRLDRHVEVPQLMMRSKTTLSQHKRNHISCSEWLSGHSAWSLFAVASTCCVFPVCLSSCGIKGKGPQQAWREKVALCWIVLLLSFLVGFFLIFFYDISCPTKSLQGLVPIDIPGGASIRGVMYNVRQANFPYNTMFDFGGGFDGFDVSYVFNEPPLPACQGINQPFASLQNPCQRDNSCLDLNELAKPNGGIYGFKKYDVLLDNRTTVDPVVRYQWEQVRNRGYTALSSTVVDLGRYVKNVPPFDSALDKFIRQAYLIEDATRIIYKNPDIFTDDVISCLQQKYYVGILEVLPPGCMFARVFIIIVSIIILGITLARFFMAVLFSYFIANKLVVDPNPTRHTKDSFINKRSSVPVLKGRSPLFSASPLSELQASLQTLNPDDRDLFTILLVTCYSEGEESLRATLDSLAVTNYSDTRKLFFIAADGLITGKGNPKSTPDTIIDMLTLDPAFRDPQPYSYLAVASGPKKHNMAKVYVGHYKYGGHSVPTVLVVKCGTPEEAIGPKPGNRGKRDSQLILMRFFSRVTLNDFMTPLDYDLFRKIHHITNVTPDFFELVLMVDADTRVEPNSLRYMVNAMWNDDYIMGLCGETKIANKKDSWVTRIQVFEYYISHHLGKAFESVFGGVTCLPGCFCMYRIKAKKGRDWIPVLVNPDIVETYSTDTVDSLHQKNLLLLGEDRFLTTLMLRKFTNRKMVFVPRALCKTVVPDDFATLKSQRRRWINSTIHNLMELVLVNNLCGTFCFSMQVPCHFNFEFIVFMDLIGTAVLPIGILTTYYLIIKAIFFSEYSDFFSVLPTVLMVIVLFLPALLVALTDFSISRIGWFLVYLASLPIWQFVLPLYAYWRFDDFSWGATRQVAGQAKDEGHGADSKDGEFNESVVPLRRWEDYERGWRQALHQQAQPQVVNQRLVIANELNRSYATLGNYQGNY